MHGRGGSSNIRVVREQTYEQWPVNMRRDRPRDNRYGDYRNNREIRPPVSGKKVFDCNGVENLDDLSLDLASHSDHDSSYEHRANGDLNLSIQFRNTENERNEGYNQNVSQNMSFVFNNSVL